MTKGKNEMQTYRILDLEQGSEQWKNYRRYKIGASDASTILDLNPWKTPLQLYEQKMDGVETPDDFHMARGRTLEPQIRAHVNQLYNLPYEPVCAQSIEYPWMIASLDGWQTDEEPYILEAKAPSRSDHDLVEIGFIPEHYMPQLQHQMIVMGVDQVLYVSFDGERYANITVLRDPGMCKEIIAATKKFYEGLMNFVPPEPTDRDFVKVEDPNLAIMARAYGSVCQKIEELEAEKVTLRNQLTDACKAYKRAIIGDLKVTKVKRIGAVDYSKIALLQDLDLSVYRKEPIEYWKIG